MRMRPSSPPQPPPPLPSTHKLGGSTSIFRATLVEPSRRSRPPGVSHTSTLSTFVNVSSHRPPPSWPPLSSIHLYNHLTNVGRPNTALARLLLSSYRLRYRILVRQLPLFVWNTKYKKSTHISMNDLVDRDNNHQMLMRGIWSFLYE